VGIWGFWLNGYLDLYGIFFWGGLTHDDGCFARWRIAGDGVCFLREINMIEKLSFSILPYGKYYGLM